MNTFFNNEGLVKYLWKKKLLFLIITIVAVLLSVIFSGPKFITPLFKSSAVLYPSSLSPYSEENETEQMLQFLKSDDILERLIKDFNLFEHYNIKKNSPHSKTLVLKKLKSNFSVGKSQYEGVEITIYDKDPKQAKIMVDSVISYYNQLVKKEHNKKYQEILYASEKEMNRLQKQIDSIKNHIKDLRLKTKVLDIKKQAKVISPKNENLYVNFLAHKEELMVKDSILVNLNKLFNKEKATYENTYREYKNKQNFYIMVSKPQIADKKSYPIRWLIVLISLIGAYILTFIVLAITDKNKSN
jgi:uncharacterized protein involved in exopolysaccharide biosynthesis